MTPEHFRQLALGFPGALESAHMSHPDFRVGGKIFATLGYPDEEYGMVVLPTEEQKRLIGLHPKIFAAAKGAWGKHGSTTLRLGGVDKATLRSVLEIAWRNKAPKRLL
jgi:hypothetical protein